MNTATQQLVTARGTFSVQIDGNVDAPAIVLSNSLGTTLDMWAPQVSELARYFRVIRYNTRGHDLVPDNLSAWGIEQLGLDVVAILDALSIQQATFCGVSMGGHTGLWLGIHAAERLNALVVCNSAAKIGTAEAWQQRASLLRSGGREAMQQLAQTAPERWFTPNFIKRESALVQAMQQQLADIAYEGYATCCDALAHSDLRHDAHRIAVPTLFIAGEFDPVTTVEDSKKLQAAVIGSMLAVLPASHISNLEAPALFTQAVRDFTNSVVSAAGLAVKA